MTLLDVTDLSVTYRTREETLHSVTDVSFTIEDGVNYALSGESASGKTTVAKAILGLLPEHGRVESGEIEFCGRDLRALTEAQRQDLRWEEIAFVPQTAIDALDPVMTVGAQVRQAIQTHRDVTTARANRRARELFELVGLNPARTGDYPHEFSGGMKQRAVIAMALGLNPKLIIADEPTTGVDAVSQDQIIENILQIQEEIDSSLLLITHDVGVIAETCDEVSVLYGGTVVEQGRVENVLLNPSHPYTMGLKNAFPDLDDKCGKLVSVPGTPPSLDSEPQGCVFESRCPFATAKCETSVPSLEKLPYRNQHTACHRSARATRMRREAADPETWGEPAAGPRPSDGEELLRVEKLRKWYEHDDSWLGHVPIDGVPLSISALTDNLRSWYEKRGNGLGDVLSDDATHIRAVDGVSLSVSSGEILGVVGESGSGKSTLAQTLVLLEEPTAGGFRFAGRPHEYWEEDLTSFRQRIQIVFQNPYESLNPRLTVGQLVREPLSIHDHRADREGAVSETLGQVGLDPADRYLDKYPSELSGGQRQRVAIARALVVDPDFLVCDEPASMLDISLKAEVLNLLRSLANTERIGVLCISHDLANLTQIADRLAIMYRGRFVERGETSRVVAEPKHPYTEALLSAVSETDPTASRERVALEGPSSDLETPPASCRFEPRCPRARDRCRREEPALDAWDEDGHSAACLFSGEASDEGADETADPTARNREERSVEDGGDPAIGRGAAVEGTSPVERMPSAEEVSSVEGELPAEEDDPCEERRSTD